MRTPRLAAVLAVAVSVLVPLSAAHAAVPTAPFNAVVLAAGGEGTYVPLAPARLLDTRSGNGAPKRILGPAATIDLQVTGRGGVPATGVGAVVLNVVATETTRNSFLSVYPAGTPTPAASSLNFPPNSTTSNSVTAKVGSGGKVTIYNNAGNTHVVVDVTGYYVGVGGGDVGGQFHPTVPERLLDTRVDGTRQMLRKGQHTVITVNYGVDVDPRVRALAVNITAVTPAAAGHLIAWNGQPAMLPGTSTVNFAKGAIVPNFAVVPVMPCSSCGAGGQLPSIGVYTTADTHLIVDIVGFFDDGTLPDGLRYRPMDPMRLVDSRFRLGLAARVGPAATGLVWASAGAEANDEAFAINLTAVTPTAATHLVVWPASIPGLERPTVSNLNPAKGAIVSNAAITQLGPFYDFNVYNNAGLVDVVIDVVGAYYSPDGTSAASVDTTLRLTHRRSVTRGPTES